LLAESSKIEWSSDVADFDVFNGDADGICALTQLRLAEPRNATLITGVKRDIELVDRVSAGPGDRVTVLDISMDKNRESVERLLRVGADVFYVDHHFAGGVPQSEHLRALINEAPEVCTSLLVNGHIKGRYLAWAVVGAFGDNLRTSAVAMAKSLNLDESGLRLLEDLGTYLNYNGYGESIDDLIVPPDQLFRLVSRHESPFGFMAEGREHFSRLGDSYAADMHKAFTTKPVEGSPSHTAVFILPNQAWARRVSGVFSNDLANQHPDRAHAILTEKAAGSYLVSVRAPLTRKKGADEICRQFATGGGRAAAAGINDLPRSDIDRFIRAFNQQFSPS